MIKNSLSIALRQMKKNPFVHSLNIAGLGIGIASFIFIVIYSIYEFTFDHFHKNVDQLYRVNLVVQQQGQDPYIGAANFPRVGLALKEEFDHVENSCRIVRIWNGGVGIVNNKPIEHENMYYADPSFFNMFSFEFIHGDSETSLSEIYSVVLKESISKLHFGNDNPVGKSIILKTDTGEETFVVTGVIKDEKATHLDIDLFMSMESHINEIGQENNRNWSWFDFVTYIKLKENTDLESFKDLLPSFIDKHGGERLGSNKISFELVPVKEIHLNSHVNQEISQNGNIKTVTFLLLVGCFIIIIAWINYVNLYTAKATDRCKEVGIRKALGTSKGLLILQFFIESAFLNLFAITIGVVLFLILSEFAQQYLDIALPNIGSISHLIAIGLLLFWIISTFLSGSYPSYFLSKFKIIPSLKGSSSLSKGGGFRKGLVVFQFMSSGLMICGTVLVFLQVKYMNSKSLGVDTKSAIVIETPNYFGNQREYLQSLWSLKNNLLNYNGVQDVSYSSDVPGQEVAWRGSSYTAGGEERKMVYKMTVGMNYLSFLKTEFLAGNNFRSEHDSSSVILNEEALNLYGFESPEKAINKQIRFTGIDTLRVIGVIKNFHQESIKEFFRPTVYLNLDRELGFLSVRVDEKNTEAFIDYARASFSELFPKIPFSYHSMENLLALRHSKESKFNALFNGFSILAIFISFIGLLGLAYYTAIKRKKEVGIRKVLGSSELSIIKLVFLDFGKLVIVGNVISIPIFWVIGTRWLNQFSFNVGFSWLIPLASVTFTLIFAFSVTLFHFMKLAKTNPIDVIKEE